jgi:SulP family sulfate permease
MSHSHSLTALRNPKHLLLSLMAGVITGILGVSVGLSLSLLIFGDKLEHHISYGIGMALFSGFVVNLVVALTSSFRGIVTYPQDTPTAVLAVVITTIFAGLPAETTEEQLLVTAIATVTLTSLLMGIFCTIIGQLKLGNLIRFIPYPVIGGFLAGTGWLLFKGAIKMMVKSLTVKDQIARFLEINVIGHWLLPIIFAVTLLLVLRRYHHWAILPGMTLGAIAIFYLVLAFNRVSIDKAREYGWLLKYFSKDLAWHPLNPGELAHAHWGNIFANTGSILSIILLSIIALLLNASFIELETKKDINLDRELRSVGIANFLASLGGGFIGFHGLHESVLSEEVGIDNRLVGIFAASVYGILLFFNPSIFALFPTPVISGLILFLALEFLLEWLYDAWFKFPKSDFLTILVILAVIINVGFLQGVIVGLVITVTLFVIKYGSISVAKHTFSGVTRQSNVDRSAEQMQLIQEQGEQIYILELQGFIFFGTANNLVKQIQDRIESLEQNPLRFILLDFRLVRGLDSSTVLGFVKIEQIAEKYSLILIFTDLAPEFRKTLQKSGCLKAPFCRLFPDLDRGLEWAENELIERARFSNSSLWEGKHRAEDLVKIFGISQDIKGFLDYLIPVELGDGEVLFQQGDDPDGLYFLETGKISVFLTLGNGETKRLRTYDSGTIIGEMGLYQQAPRSASVIADQRSRLYHLSKDSFEKMELKNPQLASTFHRFIVGLLAERLRHREKELRTLLD